MLSLCFYLACESLFSLTSLSGTANYLFMKNNYLAGIYCWRKKLSSYKAGLNLSLAKNVTALILHLYKTLFWVTLGNSFFKNIVKKMHVQSQLTFIWRYLIDDWLNNSVESFNNFVGGNSGGCFQMKTVKAVQSQLLNVT